MFLPTRLLSVAVLGLAAASMTGCSGSPVTEGTTAGGGPATTAPADATTTSAPASTTEAADSTAASIDDFCALALPFLRPVERAYVGSDEQVADLEALGEVAPDDLVDLIADITRFYDESVSPANPDSQDFVNFPSAMQDKTMRLQNEIPERCNASS